MESVDLNCEAAQQQADGSDKVSVSLEDIQIETPEERSISLLYLFWMCQIFRVELHKVSFEASKYFIKKLLLEVIITY